MNDDERTVEIERLLKERSEATARKTALLEEANELAAMRSPAHGARPSERGPATSQINNALKELGVVSGPESN